MKRKPNTLPVAERDISKLIKDQLEIYYRQGRLRYFRAHAIRPFTRKGKTFFAPVDESQKGAPDYFVFLRDAMWLLEIKRPGEELSAEQVTWSRWAAGLNNYSYYKIDTVRVAYSLLDLLAKKIKGI